MNPPYPFPSNARPVKTKSRARSTRPWRRKARAISTSFCSKAIPGRSTRTDSAPRNPDVRRPLRHDGGAFARPGISETSQLFDIWDGLGLPTRRTALFSRVPTWHCSWKIRDTQSGECMTRARSTAIVWMLFVFSLLVAYNESIAQGPKGRSFGFGFSLGEPTAVTLWYW